MGSHLLAPVPGGTGQQDCSGMPLRETHGGFPTVLPAQALPRLEPGPAPTRGAAAYCCAGSNSQDSLSSHARPGILLRFQ